MHVGEAAKIVGYSAAVLVSDGTGNWLAIRNREGKIGFPAGKVEEKDYEGTGSLSKWRQASFNAGLREFQEETGLEIWSPASSFFYLGTHVALQHYCTALFVFTYYIPDIPNWRAEEGCQIFWATTDELCGEEARCPEYNRWAIDAWFGSHLRIDRAARTIVTHPEPPSTSHWSRVPTRLRAVISVAAHKANIGGQEMTDEDYISAVEQMGQMLADMLQRERDDFHQKERALKISLGNGL